MPPVNHILIFFPKGVGGDIRRAIDDAIRRAREDLDREIRAKATMDSSAYLSRLKSLIAEKTRTLPITIRIAIIENVEGGHSEAARLAAHDPRVEDYIPITIPSFTKISDPTNKTPTYGQVILAIAIAGTIAIIGYWLYKKFKGS